MNKIQKKSNILNDEKNKLNGSNQNSKLIKKIKEKFIYFGNSNKIF